MVPLNKEAEGKENVAQEERINWEVNSQELGDKEVGESDYNDVRREMSMTAVAMTGCNAD